MILILMDIIGGAPSAWPVTQLETACDLRYASALLRQCKNEYPTLTEEEQTPTVSELTSALRTVWPSPAAPLLYRLPQAVHLNLRPPVSDQAAALHSLK